MKYILSLLLILSFVSHNLYSQYEEAIPIDYEQFKPADKNKIKNYILNINKYQKSTSYKVVSKNANLAAKILWSYKDYTNAIKYFDISIEANKNLKNDNAIAGILNYKGMVYADAKQYKKSIECFNQSLKYFKKRRLRRDIIATRKNMSLSYSNDKKIEQAIEQMELAFKMSQELNDVQEIIDCAGMLSNYYTMNDNKTKAGFYFNIFKAFSETKNKELKQSVERLSTQKLLSDERQKRKELELYKNEKELYLKDKLILKKDSTFKMLSAKYSDEQILSQLYKETINQNKIIIAEKQHSLTVTTIALIITIILLIGVVVFYNKTRILNRKIRHINDELTEANEVLTMQKAEILMQKEEIEAQRDEIEQQRDYVISQRDKIIEQNIQIKDSIHYARKIQTAIFPTPEVLKEVLPKSFALLMPRDIVSGDFYWIGKLGNKSIIAVADCTGHGVPGAFMSMLGALFLNEIVNKLKISKPSDILNRLRESVKKSLNQTGKDNEAKDGMDIALITIDMDKMQVDFAGAYNPLFIYRDNQIEIIKGDRMPIGIHAIEKDFTNHSLKINKNDKLYMFSDGYPDQIGGPQGRKFMYGRFKDMIMENADKEMSVQHKQYLSIIKKWMSYKSKIYGEQYEQIDDILLMGISI